MPQHSQSNRKVSPITTICIIVSFCIMLFAQLGFGLEYRNDCPKQPFIPIYLIVMGCGFLVFCCCDEKCSYLIAFFFFIWFIAGNACIFVIFKPKFSKYAGEEYCNETLYWFAFGSTIFTYFLLLMVCCGLCYEQLPKDDTGIPLEPLSVLTDSYYLYGSEPLGGGNDILGFILMRLSAANVGKVMPLDEAANHSELIDIQAAGDMKPALRGAESLSGFWVACPQKYETLKTLANCGISLNITICTKFIFCILRLAQLGIAK